MFGKTLKIVAAFAIMIALASAFMGCKNAVVNPKGSFDFQYDSAKLFLMRIDIYEETINPTGLSKTLGLEQYYDPLAANQFPSMIMMLLPFALLPPITANYTWLVCNILFSIGTVILIKIMFFDSLYEEYCGKASVLKYVDRNAVYTIIASVFFASLPWRNNIGNGQHTIMAFFAFLLSLWLAKKNRDLLSGFVLAASFFKYTLTLPLALFFIYKRKYKPLIIALGIHIVLTVFAAVWLEKPLISMIIEPLRVASQFGAEGSYDIGAILGHGNIGMVFAIVSTVIIAIVSFLESSRWKDEEFFSFLVIFSLIIVYHLIYDYFVMIVPLVVYLFRVSKDVLKKVSTVLLSVFTMYVFFVKRFIMEMDSLRGIIGAIDVWMAILFYSTFIIIIYSGMKPRIKAGIDN